MSKLVEKVAQQQLFQYFEETMQLNPSSHAYWKSLSTTTALAEIMDEVYQSVEEKKMESSSIQTADPMVKCHTIL